jgi:hypothetical protein
VAILSIHQLKSLEREAALRLWWPTLTDEQREQVRDRFMNKFESDPHFREQVVKLLKERKVIP